jgi:formyl-CoA transferase
VRERLQLRAEDLRHLNPRLIYASLTPYGENGPERDRTGFDTTAWWARSGLMDMVRATGDLEPAFSMPGMGDHPTAMAMYAAIVTALYRRQATGKGGEVNTSLIANGLWSNSCQVQAGLCGYEMVQRGPRGERGGFNEVFQSGDGRDFILTTTNPLRDWPLLAKAVGHEEWLDDPRFATMELRAVNARALVAALDAVFATDSFETWHSRLIDGGVTFGVVARIDDHLADDQIEANGFFPEFEDGFGLRTVDSPFYLSGVEKPAPRMAPDIGQHTEAILRECGLGDAEIAALTAEG